MKMSNSPFEIPNELRDFAERSVEQARKAFEGFLTVAQRASGVAGDATHTSQSGAKSVSAHVLAYTEQNVNAAFDLAHKLVKAKDPQEALALQSEYMKSPARSVAESGEGAQRHHPEERDARLKLRAALSRRKSIVNSPVSHPPKRSRFRNGYCN